MHALTGLKHKGRHHSGIDDTINISKLLLAAYEKGFELNQNHVDLHDYSSGKVENFIEELKQTDPSNIPLYKPTDDILTMEYGFVSNEEEKKEGKQDDEPKLFCYIWSNWSEVVLDSEFEYILMKPDKTVISHQPSKQSDI